VFELSSRRTYYSRPSLRAHRRQTRRESVPRGFHGTRSRRCVTRDGPRTVRKYRRRALRLTTANQSRFKVGKLRKTSGRARDVMFCNRLAFARTLVLCNPFDDRANRRQQRTSTRFLTTFFSTRIPDTVDFYKIILFFCFVEYVVNYDYCLECLESVSNRRHCFYNTRVIYW